MEYYQLREGQDYDFLLPQEDFRSLRDAISHGFFVNAFGDMGIRVETYEFYASLFGFSYFECEKKAVDQIDYLVIHPELLLYLKTLSMIHHMKPEQTRTDILLLLQKLGVWPLAKEL